MTPRLRSTATAAALAATTLAAAGDLAPRAEAAACAGERATRVGTPGPDRISTGTGRDVIVAFGGDDRIATGAGDDLVCAGPGSDRVLLGGGADAAEGGFGRDKLAGGAGADALRGGSNGDAVLGGAGDDTASGGILDDRVDGGPGADLVLGGHGVDRMRGGAGDDTLRGGTNGDSLDGGPDGPVGDTASFATSLPAPVGCAGTPARDGVVVDLPRGTAAGDGCDSLAGIENVLGSPFADSITGPGSGKVSGGGGADSCRGWGDSTSCGDPAPDGTRAQVYIESWRAGPGSRLDPGLVVLASAGGPAAIAVSGPAPYRVAAGAATPGPGCGPADGGAACVEPAGGLRYVVVHGSAGDDTVSIGTGVPYDATAELDGAAGDDVLSGGPGEDVLFSVSGADSLSGGGRDDALLSLGAAVTGEGDRLDAGPGDDQLVASFACGGHRFAGGSGFDVAGFARSEDTHRISARLGGSARTPGLDGCAPTAIRSSEVLEGTPGADLLHGDDAGNPFLWGRQGADRIFGHGGRDRIEGGSGRDLCSGGAARDATSGCESRRSVP